MVITGRTTTVQCPGNERRNRKVSRWCWNDCRVAICSVCKCQIM